MQSDCAEWFFSAWSRLVDFSKRNRLNWMGISFSQTWNGKQLLF